MSRKDAYHHGDLRAALLREGHSLLAERGPDAFSLNELARRVGVSTAAPYRHFPDRDHLVDAIADDGYVIFGAALADAVAGSRDEADAVRGILLAYLNFAAEHAAYFSVMFRDRGDRPNDVGPPTFVTFADAVVAAQGAGALDPAADPRALGRALWSGVHGAATLEAAGGFAKLGLDVPREQLVDEILGPHLR
jgi:AcrR family transcriptional regulator